jgi:hypothetical protein
MLNRALLFVAALALGAPGGMAVAQTPVDYASLRLEARPGSLHLVAGESGMVAVRALDAQGREVDVPVRLTGPREALRVRGGMVFAVQAGDWELIATVAVPAGAGVAPRELRIPVEVAWPAIARIEIVAEAGRLFQGTRLGHRARALHEDGTLRPEPSFTWTSSDDAVARVDRFGTVEGVAPGEVVVRAELDGARSEVRYRVEAFDVRSLDITGGAERARTGDVLAFRARARSSDGAEVEGLPVTWSYTFVPHDSIRAPGAAAIVDGGRFVAQVPGRYEVLALSGGMAARRTVEIDPRRAVRRVERIGQGSVDHVHTSDLWVFEGTDGRDYAVTGTWGGDGWAYFWDVTDPANLVRYDSIQVDARTVNDVKVSPDGRYAALSREGASNRRNGVVLIDLADPRNPTIAANYDDGLTGGVHNMFATDDYLFALSGGDKYVILDVTDIYHPTFVSEYNHPDSRIHDVWVHDGIAYSSEWGNGVVVVDVGNGRWGGSIENPVFVTNVPYPVGATHAAFPYYQESTGKVYLFLGDEILTRAGAAFEGYGSDNPYDPATGEGGVQSPSSGYIHIVDFTDPENPEDVARYEVSEFGTHNLWVEDDVMYVAYYEGGLRVVDVSGELLGNLATQGREIAVFKAFDPTGFVVNQPNAWGPQPYKGHVFFSDFNSGLWSVRVQPRERPVS